MVFEQMWVKDLAAIFSKNLSFYNYLEIINQCQEIISGDEQNFIVLFDPDFKLIYSSLERNDLQKIELLKGSKQGLKEIVLNSKKYMLAFSPVKVSESNVIWGYLYFGYSLEENEKTRIKSQLQIVMIGALIFIVASISGTLIIRGLLKPLKEIESGLKQLAEGNFSKRITLNKDDEISTIGKYVNSLADKIETILQELEAIQRDLEKQVQDRTEELNNSNEKLQRALKELQDTQQQIIQSEKQKSLSSIVSGFAHEINNPLSGILGYIDLLLMRDDIASYFKEKLIAIQKQAERIKQIVDQLSFLNPDGERFTKLEIDLVNLFEKMLKMIQPKLKQAKIVAELVKEEGSFLIFGNHFSLWMVFEGILENSIEAIVENEVKKGKIVIKINKTVDEQFILVEIIDNGGGFKNLERAFDPFYTTKNRTEKKGIGLAIAYNIIKEHSGRIAISNNDNPGATISIYLKAIRKTEEKNA